MRGPETQKLLQHTIFLDFSERPRFRTALYRIVQDPMMYRNPRKSSKYQLFAPRKHHFPLGLSNFCSGTIAGSKKILHDVLSGFPDFFDKYSKIFKFREHFCCTILYNAVQKFKNHDLSSQKSLFPIGWYGYLISSTGESPRLQNRLRGPHYFCEDFGSPQLPKIELTAISVVQDRSNVAFCAITFSAKRR